MATDESRKKSLHFLLLTFLRQKSSRVNQPHVTRELVRNLEILELRDDWKITTRLENKVIEFDYPKSDFEFYQTKSEDFYKIDPAEKNRISAQKVVFDLFSAANLIENKSLVPDELGFSFWARLKARKHEAALFLAFATLQFLFNSNSTVNAMLRMAYVSLVLLNYFNGNIKQNKRKFFALLMVLVVLSFKAHLGFSSHDQLMFAIVIFAMHLLAKNKFTRRKVVILNVIAIFGLIVSYNMNSYVNNLPHIGLYLIELAGLLFLAVRFLSPKSNLRGLLLIVSILLGVLASGFQLRASYDVLLASLFILWATITKSLIATRENSMSIFLSFGWFMK
jgi:hypothetical protein